MFPSPWKASRHVPKPYRWGYRDSTEPNIYDFWQPHIVAPDDYKEELVGGSATWGLSDPLFTEHWKGMQAAAEKAKHWLFAGYSFQSGDAHLGFILRSVREMQAEKARIHVTYISENDRCNLREAYAETLGIPSDAICFHRLGGKDHIHEIMFKPDYDCQLNG
jgi:hypothetical protein